MKLKSTLALITALFSISTYLQSQTLTPRETPATGTTIIAARDIAAEGDTATFTGFSAGTVIANQYQPQGFVFSGFNGSTAPVVEDYGTAYGLVLRSSDWFSAIRIDLVQPQDPELDMLASKIEFDNLIDGGEIDFVGVDVYNSQNELILHYMSISPDHVNIELPSSSAAWFTVDDSAGTAYILDNFHVGGLILGIQNETAGNFSLFPNPSAGFATLNSKEEIDNLKVTTLTGQLIYQTNPQSRSVSFTIENNGVYLVTIQAGNAVTTRKLVITR